MKKISIFFLIIFAINTQNLYPSENFNSWLKNFKNNAIKKGISKKTVEEVMSDAKFLPKVIEYDRYQPEFYEDTYTYIRKRSSKEKLKKGLLILTIIIKNKNIIRSTLHLSKTSKTCGEKIIKINNIMFGKLFRSINLVIV